MILSFIPNPKIFNQSISGVIKACKDSNFKCVGFSFKNSEMDPDNIDLNKKLTDIKILHYLNPESKNDFLALIFISSSVSKQSATNDGHKIAIFFTPSFGKRINSLSVNGFNHFGSIIETLD